MKVLYQDQRFRTGAPEIYVRGFSVLGLVDTMSRVTPVLRQLAARGHCVSCAETMVEALAHAQRLPDLVVVDLALQDGSADEIIRAVRALPSPAGDVPMVACAGAPADRGGLFDAVLPDHLDPAAMTAAIMLWSPVGLLDGITRLAAVFGASEIDALTVRFRTQLTQGVVALDTTPDRGAAHRIAGIAGTLGFASLGQRWLAVSEGDVTMCEAARRESRIVLHALARAAQARGLN
jgi:CheY-like chemotaxis protein